jgi:hypothetical protein
MYTNHKRLITFIGDPLDNRYVTLRESDLFLLAGEGLVAKVDIPAETIFCHYSTLLLTTGGDFINVVRATFVQVDLH